MRVVGELGESQHVGTAILRSPAAIGGEVADVVIVYATVWVDYFRGVNNPETDWLDAEPIASGLASQT